MTILGAHFSVYFQTAKTLMVQIILCLRVVWLSL